MKKLWQWFKTLWQRILHALLASDHRGLVWIGRYLQRYQQLLVGLGLGIVLAVITDTAWDSVNWWWYARNLPQRIERNLEAPPFPKDVAVDYNWTLQTLDGQALTFTELQGKVVFLNFWATWCMPCVGEMPSMQRLYDQMHTENIAFVFVSNEKVETVRKFVTAKSYTLPIYLLSGERPSVFQARGIPATFIVSKTGTLAFRYVGSAKWDDPSSIAFLKKLLGE